MSAGYLLRGTCYPSINEAAAAWVAQYPQIQGNQVWNVKSPPVVGASSFNYVLADTKAGASNDITGTITPLVCDTANVPADPLFSVVIFAACAVMFGLGFIGTR
jgi:hypothetical protein